MHMSDALITPIVGGVLWAASAAVAGRSAQKLNREEILDASKVPLMGVMGAFVFAAQMINFTIPGTGSSGHLGGGLILAAMLGPSAGFLTMAVVLTIQALFFADGGLLALGANIFNMGFFTCFVAYPLIFKPIVKKETSRTRMILASMLAAIVGLQLGAFGVVAQTALSGRSELPFSTFALLMQPIHLGIGVVEGLVSAALLFFMQRVAPESLFEMKHASATNSGGRLPRKALVFLICFTLLCGGVLSWFASSNPDGLEWAIAKTAGVEELAAPEDGVYQSLNALQQSTAILPDYSLKIPDEHESASGGGIVNGGTSISGLVGSALTLGLAGLVGLLIMLSKRKRKQFVA